MGFWVFTKFRAQLSNGCRQHNRRRLS
jgi:hypothetical protein